MTERPIIFSAPMVRALIAGTKTQTRRIIKPQPEADNTIRDAWIWQGGPKLLDASYGAAYVHTDAGSIKRILPLFCPHGVPGDRLWVRETWRVTGVSDLPVREMSRHYCCNVQYRADDDQSYIDKYRPSIFMPRWASRITLEVTDVRAQRLQEISIDDAIDEGADAPTRDDGLDGWRQRIHEDFPRLWDSINAARGFGWEFNPWVWAIAFKRLS